MNVLKAILMTVLALGLLSPSASARKPQKGDQKPPPKEVKVPEKQDKPPPSDSGKKGKP